MRKVSFHAIAPYITSLYNLDIDTPHGKKEIAMAMVTNSKINLLNYLKPTKTAWKVEVKVINSWKQHSNYPKGDTYEFILEDKMRVNIHCTCKRLFLARVKNLQNFNIYQATGIYRRTSHRFKISITGNSIVTDPFLTTYKVVFIDHNKEYSSEDVSNLSLSEGDVDLNDINSNSKKLYAKNIEMDKT
ncbi:LOW QUALITY PROTEIN: hypothetical protein HID58_014488 [Brassica napus]|uniref:Replication protein A 70 kDa DNA-binding subunit B/D first OB fold domain-containing protein n=1 Tax=Brassica napus TaxID=3708 RepID=A0ABQ8DJV6_BRANA|nr:LOW QUALITY PROTEIN: hypothetical protein HID58_014488 [Brassica napus]